jgi:Ni,Fe-hydrogenase III large subunit
MDSTLISGKRYLFAYCITDGVFDDLSEERRTAILLDITEIKERMLSGEDANSESLLSGKDANKTK